MPTKPTSIRAQLAGSGTPGILGTGTGGLFDWFSGTFVPRPGLMTLMPTVWLSDSYPPLAGVSWKMILSNDPAVSKKFRKM